MDPQAAELLTEERDGGTANRVPNVLRQAAPGLRSLCPPYDSEFPGVTLCREASIHCRLGHFKQARHLAAEALNTTTASSTQVEALIIAAACTAALDDLATSEKYLQLSIDLSRQTGDTVAHSLALRHLAGHVHLRRGHFSLALTTAEAAARIGPPDQQPPTWLLRAWIYQLTGARQRARDLLQELHRYARPDSWIAAATRYIAAQLALDEDNLEQARPLLDEALVIAEATGHPMLCVGVRIAFSRWHRLNEDGAAYGWAGEALLAARRLGSRFLEGQALVARGQAAWQASDPQSAHADLWTALVILDELGAAYDAAFAALLLSALYQQLGRGEAEPAWIDAARRITTGGYGFLLERERPVMVPLLMAHLRSAHPEVHTAANTLFDELMRSPPPPLHIAGLGHFEVRQGHRCIPVHSWEQRKAGELFRFLLVQPHHRACRDVIVEALWPSRPRAAGDRLLQQATWTLRHVLEPDLPVKFPSRYLTVADHQITLNIPPGSTIDFESFERVMERAFSVPWDELGRILALYTGDLFPNDRYADWSVGPRERLVRLYRRGLLRLAEQYLEGHCPEQALDCCDHLTAQDPWSEEATKIAMLACLARNDRPGALRRYEALKRILRHDLNLAPRADLHALAETIRRGD